MGEDGVLINNAAQTGNKRERVSSWVSSLLHVVTQEGPFVIKKPTQSTSRSLLQNIRRTFFQNTLQSTFVVDRNEILRSYPILSDLRYPKALVIMAPKHERSSRAVRMNNPLHAQLPSLVMNIVTDALNRDLKHKKQKTKKKRMETQLLDQNPPFLPTSFRTPDRSAFSGVANR